MNLLIENDIAAFSRIEAVGMILNTLQKLTGMRVSFVNGVDSAAWTVCAVVDNAEFGLKSGDQMQLSTTY